MSFNSGHLISATRKAIKAILRQKNLMEDKVNKTLKVPVLGKDFLIRIQTALRVNK